MLKYEDISPVMRAYIGAWEGFRKLGFRAEDLTCAVHTSLITRVPTCFVKLEAQGKTFFMDVGPVSADEKTFNAEYLKVCEAMNAEQISQEDFDRIWQESQCYRDSMGFLSALLAKGFRIPKSMS